MSEKSERDSKIFQSYIDNIKAKTGKSPKDFQALAKKKGLTQHGEIVAWLKSEFGLGHGHANAIVHLIKSEPTAGPAKGDDRSFRKMRAEYRALTRYIFPGGELDHLGMSVANLERAKFEVHDVEGWRRHYARTTRLWWERLNARRAEAEAEVGPEKTRLWLLYFAGCSLAFERGAVGIFQTVAQKRAKGFSPLPATRADLYERKA